MVVFVLAHAVSLLSLRQCAVRSASSLPAGDPDRPEGRQTGYLMASPTSLDGLY
jgi:hypothetical protein